MTPLTGLGKVAMWGMSPACDLFEVIGKEKLEAKSDGTKREINILLIGQNDIRHSLKTLTTHWQTLQENGIRINFYAVDSCLELYSRQMLFWAIALEPLSKFGLHEKTAQFMEIFGNTLIRPKTKKTLISFTDELIKVATEHRLASKELLDLFDFSEMKFRERDGIVEVFKFWKNYSDNSKYDIMQHWDIRLRHYLTTRYDSRFGVFDWDYHMKLAEKGITIISSGEYKQWRDRGLAFAEFESHYSQSNLTLVSVQRESAGFSGVRSSYWGDIVTGPFVCHGVECTDKSVYEKTGEMFKKKSYDVTFHNLEEIFAVTSILNMNSQSKTELTTENINGNDGEYEEMSCGSSVNGLMSVHFVSFSNFMKMPENAKYSEYFDVIYFGNNMAHHILPHFKPIFASNVILMAENARYALEFRTEQEELFTAKLTELAEDLGMECLYDVNSSSSESDESQNENQTVKIKPAILKFVRKSETEKTASDISLGAGAVTTTIGHNEISMSEISLTETIIMDSENSGGDPRLSSNGVVESANDLSKDSEDLQQQSIQLQE